MGVVDLSQDVKGETTTSSGISSKEEKGDVDEGVNTSEEKLGEEPKDWRSEGPGSFKMYKSDRGGSSRKQQIKSLMIIRAKRSTMRVVPDEEET